MALIVEDGSIVANAESYVDVAFADAYWAVRLAGKSWPSDVTMKEKVLREAAQFLDMSYLWDGQRSYYTQVMHWPRVIDVYEDRQQVLYNQIPVPLKNAQCELALLVAVTGRLMPVLKRGGLIKSTTVGPIEIVYMDGAGGTTRYDYVTLLLQDFTRGERMTGATARAIRG